MNEMETQLSRLFNAAVGEPPNQVTPHAARRQALKRRVIACVSATAALVVAGSIGLAVAANAIAPHRVTNSHHALTKPKFYFTQDYVSERKSLIEDVVRSSATGAITGRVSCPGRNVLSFGAAADGHQTFYFDCVYRTSSGVWTGTRIYRFHVLDSGRVSGFGLLPGGNLPGLRGANLGVTADGAALGIDVAKASKGPISEVLLINTRTGRHTIWHSDTLRGGITFHPLDLSFANGGRELGVLGYDTCSTGIGSHCKNDPGEEMRVVGQAAKGGNLSSGHRIFVQSSFGGKGTYVQDAFLSPDGATVIVGVQSVTNRVVQISSATGKTLRTLFNTGTISRLRMIGVDSSGRFVLYNGFADKPLNPRHLLDNGWIDHGKLRLLKPAHGDIQLFAW